jgi:hypothetical protein
VTGVKTDGRRIISPLPRPPCARQPRARNLLVLQQLGLQCSSDNLREKTGLKIGEAFYQRIAKPIGMQEFQPGDVSYLGGPLSVHSACHFEITARDLARFGLLYLHRGRSNDKQIVPEAWVEKSTHAYEMAEAGGVDVGVYEYLWWVEYGGVHFRKSRSPECFPREEWDRTISS